MSFLVKIKTNGFTVFILSFCISLGMLVCPGFVRMFSFRFDFWISYSCYFAVVLLMVKKLPAYRRQMLFAFLMPIFLVSVYMLFTIREKFFLLPGLPNMIGIVLSIICGYIFCLVKSIVTKSIIVVASAAICIFYFFWGIWLWINFGNFQTFTGRVNEHISPSWVEKTSQPGDLEKALDGGQLLVIDFWSTGCANCFREFPQFQKLYDQYKGGNYKVSFVAVDIPWRSDTPGEAMAMIQKKHYTFPVLQGKEGLDSAFKIDGFPTTIIIRDSTIVFRGEIKLINNAIRSLLRL